MTTQELYEEVINQVPIKEIPPLYKAIMEECCDNAIKNSDITDEKTLVYAAQSAFIVSIETLKSVLSASVNATNADQVTLNYRSQTFIIPKESKLILGRTLDNKN